MVADRLMMSLTASSGLMCNISTINGSSRVRSLTTAYTKIREKLVLHIINPFKPRAHRYPKNSCDKAHKLFIGLLSINRNIMCPAPMETVWNFVFHHFFCHIVVSMEAKSEVNKTAL